jgi:hypothetical protein
MPTTSHEALEIVEIARRHFPDMRKLRDLFTELDVRVGRKSDNSSVRESFAMFRGVVEVAYRRDEIDDVQPALDVRCRPEDRLRWKTYFFAVVALHHFLVLGNVASFLTIPFAVFLYGAPWYFAFPAWFSILWVTSSPAECVFTRMENQARLKLGWPCVRTFVGHYYVKRFYKLRAGLRRRRSIVAHG